MCLHFDCITKHSTTKADYHEEAHVSPSDDVPTRMSILYYLVKSFYSTALHFGFLAFQNAMPTNRAWQNSQESNTKNTKRSLTIHDKLEIIRLTESGEKKQVRIAEQFGIARSTVTAIKNKRDKYLSFLSLNHTPSARSHRTLHQPKDMAHQQAVYHWYLDQVNSGQAVSNAGLLARATVLHQELHGSEQDYDPEVFQRGAKGWLTRFKNRFEIYSAN